MSKNYSGRGRVDRIEDDDVDEEAEEKNIWEMYE